MPGEAFQRPEPTSRRHLWRDEQMDMVGHHDEGMQAIPLETRFAVDDCPYHEAGDLWLSQEERTNQRAVQNAIHGRKGPAGCHSRRREDAIRREAVVQAKGDEHRLSDDFPVRKAALVLPHHPASAGGEAGFSKVRQTAKLRRAEARRQPERTAPH